MYLRNSTLIRLNSNLSFRTDTLQPNGFCNKRLSIQEPKLTGCCFSIYKFVCGRCIFSSMAFFFIMAFIASGRVEVKGFVQLAITFFFFFLKFNRYSSLCITMQHLSHNISFKPVNYRFVLMMNLHQ